MGVTFLNIVRVDPRNDQLWQRLVEQAPSGVFHSPSWIQVLTDTYGWQASAYVILDDRGEPCAGIPFCRITDILGERIVALPFSDYCDPLVNDAHSWRLRDSLSLRRPSGMVWICGRSRTHFGLPCTIPLTGPSGNLSGRASLFASHSRRRNSGYSLRCI